MKKNWREYIPTTQIGIFDCIVNPPHIHKEVELIYVTQGVIIANCEGKLTELKAGTFFLVAPNQVHYYEKGTSEISYLYLVCDTRHLKGYSVLLSKKIPINNACNNKDNGLIELFNLSIEEVKNEKDSPILDGLLSALIGKLLRYYEFTERTANNDIISEIFNYCTEHFTEAITADEIAEKLHISRYYLSHIFNDKLKISFKDYINSLRADEALRLIESGECSITEAALASGFSTIRTFNRAFKKIYGISPREYLITNTSKTQI